MKDNFGLTMSGARYGVLVGLAEYIQENGYSPSVRELAGQLEVSSHSSVHFHLDSLHQDGFLLRRPRKSRSWNLTAKGRGVLSANSQGMPVKLAKVS